MAEHQPYVRAVVAQWTNDPAPEVTEASFTDQVLELAKLLRWTSTHFRPARTSHGWRTPVSGDGAGFPDILLIRRDRLVVAELKARRGRLTHEQLAWLDLFRGTGAEAYVWRPADLDDIARILR
jgi:hypothetical protein